MDSPTLGFPLGLGREEPWQKIRRREESTFWLFIPLGSPSEVVPGAISFAQANVTAPLQKVFPVSLKNLVHQSLPFSL